MKDPYLLHIFSPTRHASPFDVNMAYEAAYDSVITYTNVALEDVPALTQDTIFSRGPKGVKRTGIFIGGREFGLAMDMLEAARNAMVPPFEVSVFADPSGAITTAAALIASVERQVALQGGGTLAGKVVQVFGGTGPVGICSGLLADLCGARVQLVSHMGTGFARQKADEYNARYGTHLMPADCSTDASTRALLKEADIVIGAAKAGVRVLTAAQLATAGRLLVAADVNAVPPSGIEGIDVNDLGTPVAATPRPAVGLGALAIGDIKYKVHTELFRAMYAATQPVYLEFRAAFEVARRIVAD